MVTTKFQSYVSAIDYEMDNKERYYKSNDEPESAICIPSPYIENGGVPFNKCSKNNIHE